MTRARLISIALQLVALLAVPGLVEAVATAPEESSKASKKGEAYVILTDSEATPEDLLRRYPELASPWEELARFNLLRRPGTTIEIPREMLRADRTLAKVAGVYGEAEVQRSFDDGYIALVDNLLLREGDVVRTWRHSGARIVFENGTNLVLRSHSKARLISLQAGASASTPDVRLELIDGNIWSRTVGKSNGKFVIETPTASTIIRGTDFRLKVEVGQATRLEVLEGVVEFEAGDETVMVPAQQGILSRANADVSDLQPLPEAPAELLEPHEEQVFRAAVFEGTFRWTPVAGAQSYRLEIARDEGFFDLVEERLTGRTLATVGGLEPGTYFWRVSALSPNGFEGPPASGSYFVFVEKRP